MKNANIVFVAQSLDGYIADKNGGIDWLNSVPNPDNIDMGFLPLLQRVDAIVMGRNTFETVAGFDGEWPYSVPVFVMSTTMDSIPEKYADKVELIKGSPIEVTKVLNNKGFLQLYIDGGKTIQSFITDGLVDEIVLTTIPVLLGDGFSLFGKLEKSLNLKLVNHQVFLGSITQATYKVEM